MYNDDSSVELILALTPRREGDFPSAHGRFEGELPYGHAGRRHNRIPADDGRS